MKPITISEASRLAAVSRQTIYNLIDKGELSRSVTKMIDLSELIRVYPNISIDSNAGEVAAPTPESVKKDILSVRQI